MSDKKQSQGNTMALLIAVSIMAIWIIYKMLK